MNTAALTIFEELQSLYFKNEYFKNGHFSFNKDIFADCLFQVGIVTNLNVEIKTKMEKENSTSNLTLFGLSIYKYLLELDKSKLKKIMKTSLFISETLHLEKNFLHL